MVDNNRTDDGESWNKRRNEVLQRDNYRCQYCGTGGDSTAKLNLEVHHIHLDDRGGTDGPDNLITLCTRCHSAVHRYGKGDVRKPNVLDELPFLPHPSRHLNIHIYPEDIKIMDAIQNGVRRPINIIDRIQYPDKKLSQRIRILRIAGCVSSDPDGVYELTDKAMIIWKDVRK